LSRKIQFILASGSPRRKELLAGLGLGFRVVVPDIDESFMQGETPQSHTRRLARQKAEAVAVAYPDRWVLGADTIVLIDGRILGKPKSEAEAFRMLNTIQGRVHRVITSFCIMRSDPHARVCRTVISRVRMRSLTGREIGCYIKTAEPMDKAGSYAVQGIGASLVQSVHGSYTNVVGLPLAEVILEMERLGVCGLFAPRSSSGRGEQSRIRGEDA